MKEREAPDDWTRSYFGRVYGEVYRRHLLPPERARQEAEFATAVLGLESGQRVLDLAAGFGRHARLLARRLAVVALDQNKEYLRTARAGLRGRAARRLMALAADMRTLPFAEAKFDAVLLLFNSFGYFHHESGRMAGDIPEREMWRLPRVFYERNLVSADHGVYRISAPGGAAGAESSTVRAPAADPNLQVLDEVARVLRRGGQFLMEQPNPGPVVAAVAEHPRRHFSVGRYSVEEEFRYDPARRVLENCTVFRGPEITERAQYMLRLYTRDELARALRARGLRVVATFGDYAGTAYQARDSDCILLHARRA
jgi:SAM-dependent methyltransferase